MKTLSILGLLAVGFLACEDDEGTDGGTEPTALEAGTLSGGPFSFAVDGSPDLVSGITLTGFSGSGKTKTYVITDDDKNILRLPPTLDALFEVDFDGAGIGVCYIYHLTYDGTLAGLEESGNLDELSGVFDLSNFLVVNRNALDAGELVGGPYDFVVDGLPDMIMHITLDATNLNGNNQTFVITDDAKNILGIPPTLEVVMGVDFDGAGEGKCYVYHLTYSTGLEGLETGNNLEMLTGAFGLSNFLEVNRNPLNAGSLSGGPYDFTVDGNPDMVTSIMFDDMELNGSMNTFVITDEVGNILGLPPTIDAVRGVDFDEAGTGVCFIYSVTYSTETEGLEAGNNLGDLEGVFALSNQVVINRNALNAGALIGGPYNFSVDGMADMVTGISLDASNLTGSEQTYVITDDNLNILGLPPTLEALEGVDFDGAGIGVCQIWHLTYEGEITGLAAGENAADLEGNFALSNSVEVYRNPNAGEISG